jgi:hypothetical protein
MIDCRGGPRLAAEALHRLRVASHLIRKKLQADEPPEAGVLGFIDHTHSAAVQLLEDPARRQMLA